MKQNIKYIKTATTGALLLCLVFFFTSCVKSRYDRTDFSTLQPVVLIPEGGLAAFKSQALLFPGSDLVDTTLFYVNYAATNVAPVDETITLTVDKEALSAFNATSTLQYKIFPDSIYSFKSTSVIIKKGNNYSDAIPLVVFPSKINPTLNLMLPISIATAPVGASISSNFKTIYYHFIGNPLAGGYNQEWIRYNNATSTGTPAFDQKFDGTLSPIDGTTVSAKSGTGVSYIITFTAVNGIYSNFEVSFDPADVKNAGITITNGPTIVLIDPVKRIFKFTFGYLNASGAARTIYDNFTK